MNISTLKTKIKKQLLKHSSKFNHIKATIKCKHLWYGNTYGGFFINPDFVNETAVVYSFGIGQDISFDRTVIEKHNCQVFGFDPTPKSIAWISEQILPDKFTFYDYGISDKSGFVDFYLPKNPDHVSGSLAVQSNVNLKEKVTVKMKSITDIIAELGHTHIDVIKMDIEGSEYDVITDILRSKISVNQYLIEFHDRFVDNGKQKSEDVIKKFKENGYEIFGISDTYEEISFLKKSLLN